MKNKKTSSLVKIIAILLPIAFALLIYILFAVCGENEDKSVYLIITPIVSVLGYAAVYFMINVQLKYFESPKEFWIVAKLLFILIFAFCVISTFVFINDVKSAFSPFYCVGWSVLGGFMLIYKNKNV